MASRRNEDGTTSFVTLELGFVGDCAYDFVKGQRDGTKTLTIREAQHEYVFSETL